jgi:hypothetical protein
MPTTLVDALEVEVALRWGAVQVEYSQAHSLKAPGFINR